ncbi:substrate-binding domain-containing protein [Paenarthrobacter sp. NPDC092416]|uniref:substrate-binding domain-containing protein n=1 Tax=Paenarthrobacter sp. NPDC092416 TaxID=3364386 RepID=UPI0037F826CF
MKSFIRTTLVTAVSGTLLLTGCSTGTEPSADGSAPVAAADLKGKVYFLTPNSQVTRFDSYDTPNLKEALAKYAPGLELVTQSADNDPSRQLQQAQAAVTQGAKAIIMAPPVPDQSQSVVAAAHAANIPVIDFAYASTNSEIDYYVTVPFEPIGEQVAKYAVEKMKDTAKPLRIAEITGDPSFFFDTEIRKGTAKVLDPLVKTGDVEVVCQNDNLQLSADNARLALEGCMQRAGGDLDAVIVHNDSSANGVLAALSAQDLLGKVKVFGGYDAQPGVVQHLLAGNIENTMVPPYKAMADATARLIVAKLTGDGSDKDLATGTYDTGIKKVPTVYNENVFITADNVGKELIDTGLLKKTDVCAGPAVTSEFCKQ